MRAIKNRTVSYLDSLDEERRGHILEKAVTYWKQRDQSRKGQGQLQDELIRRQEKTQKRDSARQRELERKWKKNCLESIVTDFTVTERHNQCRKYFGWKSRRKEHSSCVE